MKDDMTQNEIQIDPANKLKDDELTSVSGGGDDLPDVFRFHRSDGNCCCKKFDIIACFFEVYGGRCPKLIIDKTYLDFIDFDNLNFDDMDYKYTVSCSDGYFSKHTFTSIMSRL